jgi:hypothetical protein
MDRPLETGWLPDTPIGDTLFRRFLHNQAEHNEAIAAAHGGRAERTDDVFLADAARPVPYYNQAILSRPLLSAGDPVLDTVDAFFDGRSEITLLSIWPTPDLTARGWTLGGHPAIVVRSAAPVPTGRRNGVEVRRAETTDDFRSAERIVIEGYPLDSAGDAPAGSLLPEKLADSGITVRLGLLNGEPVAVGNVFVRHGLVNLALAATLPAARRRGVWEALVWARVADAPDLPAVAYTSDDSRPGFVRMGFLPVTRFTLWWR